MSIAKLTNHTVRFADGRKAKIIAVHAAGKHIRYTFEDGSCMMDIHNLIEDGSMEVLRRAHHDQVPVYSAAEDDLDVAPEFTEEENTDVLSEDDFHYGEDGED